MTKLFAQKGSRVVLQFFLLHSPLASIHMTLPLTLCCQQSTIIVVTLATTTKVITMPHHIRMETIYLIPVMMNMGETYQTAVAHMNQMST